MMFMAHLFDHELYGVYDGLVRETVLDLKDDFGVCEEEK
jgi:hypothetical protein